jgi:hypothetical protein
LPTVWHPLEVRFTDLEKDRLKTPDEMTKREAEMMKEVQQLKEQYEDIDTSHPLVKMSNEEYAEQMRKLEPMVKEAQ